MILLPGKNKALDGIERLPSFRDFCELASRNSASGCREYQWCCSCAPRNATEAHLLTLLYEACIREVDFLVGTVERLHHGAQESVAGEEIANMNLYQQVQKYSLGDAVVFQNTVEKALLEPAERRQQPETSDHCGKDANSAEPDALAALEVKAVRAKLRAFLTERWEVSRGVID